MLDFTPFTFLMTIVNLLVLFIVLRKLLLKPVSEMLEKRRQMIYNDLNNAKRDKEEARILLEQHRQMLAQGKDEATKIIQAAVNQAEERREDLLAKAEIEATVLIQRAKVEIGREQAKAVEQLRTEIAVLSVAVAEKLLGHSVVESDQDRIFNEALEGLGESYAKYSS